MCPLALLVKNPPANAGDIRDSGLSPRLGRSPGRGHGNRLQYSCLENPHGERSWRAAVHGVARSRTRQRLSTLLKSFTIYMFFQLCNSLFQREKFFTCLKIPCASNPNSIALKFTEKEVPMLLRSFRVSHEKTFLEDINVTGT